MKVPQQLKPRLALGEILSFSYDTFRGNKVRFALTALGMVIGTAALILVVTIGLSGRQYVLGQIQAAGSNMIHAEYSSAGVRAGTQDSLTVDDVRAVQEQVRSIVAASPFLALNDRIGIGNGKQQDMLVLGVFPEYKIVRNLTVLSGRFFDEQDQQARNKVGVITDKLAKKLYGSTEAAVGRQVKLIGLPFTIIGTFKEGVETFGLTEVEDNTVVIPYTVSRFFTPNSAVKEIYFSVADSSQVPRATEEIRQVLHARHRAESVYNVQNLTELLAVADRSAMALTLVLMLVAAVVLLVSGIGIMNIMLSTVSSRIREIGIRKALGATNREIRYQFLAEAILISLVGGVIGIVIGLAIPFSVRYFTDYHVPISGFSAIVAIVVSTLVGIVFGTVPATRAAQLDPVESLRYE
jgi:putative ABC transport system permease protein